MPGRAAVDINTVTLISLCSNRDFLSMRSYLGYKFLLSLILTVSNSVWPVFHFRGHTKEKVKEKVLT